MKRKDDSKPLYDLAGKFDGLAVALFWANALASVCALLKPQLLAELVFWAQLFSAIGYVLLTACTDGWLWFEAEKSRRLNCLSDGFGVNLTERQAEKYYDNPLPSSIQRYAANNFESALYSQRTALAMMPALVIKVFLVAGLFFVFLRDFESGDVVLLVAQICFSAVFFSDQLMIVFFYFRVKSVYDRFYTAFITDGCSDTPLFNAKVLSYSVEYESIKAFYKVRLSEKRFQKVCQELDPKWKEISKHLCMPSEKIEPSTTQGEGAD